DPGPDVLQRDTGVQQPLDHLQDQNVLERVEPLRARAVRGADAGRDQLRAGPVVELTVGDPGDLASGRTAVADQLVRQRLIGEELTLLASLADRDRNRLFETTSVGATSLDHASLPSPDPSAGERQPARPRSGPCRRSITTLRPQTVNNTVAIHLPRR